MADVYNSRVQSNWTPLNNDVLNGKLMATARHPVAHSATSASKHPPNVDPLRSIFNERRALVGKWFDKWNDAQRLLVLQDMLSKCKVKQLEQAISFASKRKPMLHEDFTRNFPRVLSLYVFSFLDPRSLCRCAQVSWQWKYLTEMDQLWMKKCLKLGWILPFKPSPYETGLWKRLYIENIVAFKKTLSNVQKIVNGKQLENAVTLSKSRDGRDSALSSARSRHGASTPSGTSKKPPWKGSDPTPKDTWRNNYLANDDEIEKVNKLRKKGLCGPEADEIQRRARQRVHTGQHSLKRANSLTRAKSVTMLGENTSLVEFGQRPSWAAAEKTSPQHSSHVDRGEELDPRSAFQPVSVNSGRRSRLSTQRSARDPPSTDLFPSKPWMTPAEDDADL